METHVFLTVFRLGLQPASVIARHVHMERTTVYKMLLRLNRDNLVSMSKKRGIIMFYIPDISVVHASIREREKALHELDSSFEVFANEVKHTYGSGALTVPKITIFDGVDKIAHLYADILKEIESTGYRFLRMFASNTHTEQFSQIKMKDIAQKFFHEIKERNIVLDCYIGDGALTMERISKRTHVDEILHLPAASAATNIYVIGNAIYLLIFKDEPIGIKIQNSDLAQSLHFILDQLKVV